MSTHFNMIINRENITMKYEDDPKIPKGWVVLYRGEIEVYRFPYQNMSAYVDLYRMPIDARESVLLWAKMLQNPD